jgi:hypothetical protein
MHDQAKPYKRGNQGINDAASKRSKKKPSKKKK